MPSLVHAIIMTTAGLVIVLRSDWQSPTIFTDKNELVRAGLAQHVHTRQLQAQSHLQPMLPCP